MAAAVIDTVDMVEAEVAAKAVVTARGRGGGGLRLQIGYVGVAFTSEALLTAGACSSMLGAPRADVGDAEVNFFMPAVVVASVFMSSMGVASVSTLQGESRRPPSPPPQWRPRPTAVTAAMAADGATAAEATAATWQLEAEAAAASCVVVGGGRLPFSLART